MRAVLRWTVLALTLAVPALAAEEPKPTDPTKLSKDPKEASAKMLLSGQVSGKVVHWEAAQKYFTLQVTIQYVVPNDGEIREVARIEAAIAQTLAGGASPADKQRTIADYQRQLAYHQARVLDVKSETRNLEFQVTDETKFRKAELLKFDDKGSPRKPTAAEIKEAKGDDPRLPGYTATMSDMHQDIAATVYLKKKPKDAKEAGGLPEGRLEAAMILILGDVKK
jgi:hypothetical protein